MTDTNTITAKEIAIEIVGQMSADDMASFEPDAWREGVGNMLQGDWAGADLDAVLAAVADTLSRTDFEIRCNPFGLGVRTHRVSLDYSGPGRPAVRVWDDIAGHYTACHQLSPRTQRRIALAWERECETA